MIQFRLYFDKDAETQWLNHMSAQGWAMKRFFAGFYSFEKSGKGEYTYQVDFGDRMFKVSDAYREFMQDTGIEIVQTWGYWVILRRKASDGKFELYTDVDSSIRHYTKIRRMFEAVTIIELICMLVELYIGLVTGVEAGLACALILAAILITCVNQVRKLNNTIEQLQARMEGTEDMGTKKRCRNISGFLAAGLLINSCVLMLSESISRNIKISVQLAAIILMLVGLVQTCRRK